MVPTDPTYGWSIDGGILCQQGCEARSATHRHVHELAEYADEQALEQALQLAVVELAERVVVEQLDRGRVERAAAICEDRERQGERVSA